MGAGVLSILTGCASVTHGTTQNVKIETLTAEGKVINGAKCLITNDRNDSVMRSGDTVPIRRSGANLNIECSQPGLAPANGQAVSRANVGMAGNILLGGMIGAVVDASTAAGYNYPSWIQLIFGEVRNVDRSAQSGDGPTAGIKIGATEIAAAPKAVAVKPPEAPRPVPVVPAPSRHRSRWWQCRRPRLRRRARLRCSLLLPLLLRRRSPGLKRVSRWTT
ncbi:hypothetical protein [Variovorax sp. E3]|uniref:hypothetical protein n=1 Tax=Variovorax sp. E3 TaxID=1914993 RepID=UPI0018DB7DE4|nr:hypothetical protein [Variovorax sp. E3]